MTPVYVDNNAMFTFMKCISNSQIVAGYCLYDNPEVTKVEGLLIRSIKSGDASDIKQCLKGN